MIFFGIFAIFGFIGLVIYFASKASANSRVNKATNLSISLKELQALWLENVMELGYDIDSIDADAFKAKDARTSKKILDQLENDSLYQQKVEEVINGFNIALMKESTKDKYTRILKPYLTEEQISRIMWMIGQ